MKSFSQTVTKTNIDTIVPLKVPVAKLVIKDLIKGDGAVVEIKELNKVIGLKDEQLNLFKQKDTLKDQKISNLELIITKKDEQFGLERAKSESLLKEIDDKPNGSKMSSAFKALKIVNFESTKLVGKGDFYLIISHRFDYLDKGIEDFFGSCPIHVSAQKGARNSSPDA